MTKIKQTKCFFFRLLSCSLSAVDSDSEEDECQYYLASESSGKSHPMAPRPNHNLSLLSLTVIIGKGRLQARTDKKVNFVDFNCIRY